MKNFILILFSCFVFLNGLTQPTLHARVLGNVFLIYNTELKKYGTSFFVIKDSNSFLITAKHTFKNYKNGDKIVFKILRDSLAFMEGNIYFDSDSMIDVAVIRIKQTLFSGYIFVIKHYPFALSDDGYLIGFPLSLYSTGENIVNKGYPIPLIKKATYSGILRLKEGKIIKYLFDGHNNPGFSGGPIVMYDEESKTFQVAGVISAYYIQEEKATVNDHDISYNTNSGIIITYAATHIEKIIEKISK